MAFWNLFGKKKQPVMANCGCASTGAETSQACCAESETVVRPPIESTPPQFDYDPECSVEELYDKRQRNDEFLLLDVRTQQELDRVKLSPCLHIPLHDLENTLDKLAEWREKEIITMCHHGGRSAMAQEFLLSEGFRRVRNLTGGIHEYAEKVDSSLPVYH